MPAPRQATRPAAHALRVLAAALLLASAAYAAVTMTYNTAATQGFSVKPPPIVWAAGPDASGNNFAASWSLSANATYYTITLRPVPEANVTWGNLTTLQNQDSAAFGVVVSATSLASYAKVLDFKLEFRAYGTDALAGTLDVRAASPSLDLGSVAASAKYYVKAWIKLADGTGAGDLPTSISIGLSITP